MNIKKFMMSFLALAAVSASPFTYAMPIANGVVREVNEIETYGNDQYEARTSLQPLATGYGVKDILEWTPEKDVDARYNRSTIPLQDRYQGPVVNPNASADAKIMNCALTNADTNNAPSQGSDTINNYMFSYWQYIDSYVYWGGVDEGIFCIPTPDIIDNAHKNGVPIVATVGFPWGSGSGYVEQVRAFCQKDENGNFPVADKMLEIMEFYGFDGYFINQETYGCSSADARNMADMFIYMREKNPDIILSWYDSMTEGGGVSYQDALNDRNSFFFQQGDNRIMDEFFLNYNWTSEKANTSVATANKLGRSPFDVYAGLDVQQNAYNTNFRVRELLDENGKLKISLAMYCPNSTLSMAKDVADFYKHDQKFWVGPTGNPAATDTAERWVGLANYVADKTAINETFVTNFNLGHGYKYFIDGEEKRDKEWNNRSMQDYLPTWRWTVESTGAKLKPDFDFTDAYNGGNSLKVEGNLDAGAPNHIKLYSTDVAVTENTDAFEITYKPINGEAKMQVGLCFGETYEEENFTFFDVTRGELGEWNKLTIDLSQHIGQSVKAISLRFESEVDVTDYSMNIGEFAMRDQSQVKVLAAPATVTFDEIMMHHAASAELRMYWDKVTDKNVAFYEIYRVTPNGEKEFVGATPNNAYYVAPFDRYQDEESFNFEVVAVDKNYNRGEARSIEFEWTLEPNDTGRPSENKSVNVALNRPVTANRENTGEPAHKAVDGEVGNNSKWCATNARNGWMSIDLEEPKTIQRWVVQHAEAGGENPDMNTNDFDLQVSYDGGVTYENIDVVNGNSAAITDRVLSEPVTAQHFRLNVRDSGNSPWGAIRIYEFELYESADKPETDYIPMHFGKVINAPGNMDIVTFVNVPKGQNVMLYKTLEDTEPFATQVAGVSGKVTFTGLDFGTESGRVFYAVQEEGKAPSFKLSLGYDAEEGVITPIPGHFTLKEYDATAYGVESYYGTLQIHDLQPGDVVNYYDSVESITPIKTSVPVAKGSNTAIIERILLDKQGGDIILEVEREGMKPTPKFVAKYTDTKQVASKGSLEIDVKNEEGIMIMGVAYEIIKDGVVIGEVATDHSGVGRSQDLDPGTYTLRFKQAPDMYAPDTAEYTLEITEPFAVARQEIILKAQGPALTLTGETEVVEGRSFDVTVGLTDMEEKAYAQDFVATFDPEVVEFVGVEGVAPTMVVQHQETEGSVRVLLATQEGLKSDGESATLKFATKRGKANEQTTIEVTAAQVGTVANETSQKVEVGGTAHTVQIKEAAPIDKQELAVTLETARGLSEGAVIGDRPGQYPQSAKDTLDAAILVAQGVMDASEDQVQIDAAVTTLREAIETFKEAVITTPAEDVNEDGRIDVADLALVAYYYKATPESPNWNQAQVADVDGSKEVGLEDLTLVARQILGE